MKIFGKINNYNGVYGQILGDDGLKYTLLDVNILDDSLKDVDINKKVEFEPEYIKRDEFEANMAHFVKVIKDKRP